MHALINKHTYAHAYTHKHKLTHIAYIPVCMHAYTTR